MEPMDTTPAASAGAKRPFSARSGAHHAYGAPANPSHLVHGTQSPFQPTAASAAVASSRPPFARLGAVPSAAQHTLSACTMATDSPSAPDDNRKPFDPSKHPVIPDELPHVTPSYPAALFGGLSADDEHVTVWEPATGKTVAGNAAPYRRNLTQWLEAHQGWEEKADELKSSKRRAAARRSKTAATCFASLCAFPVAATLARHALQKFRDARVPDPAKSLESWSPEDYVRLQEALFRVGKEAHAKYHGKGEVQLAQDCWDGVCSHVGANKKSTDVVFLAHHMLQLAISKSAHELKSGIEGSATSAVAIPGRSDGGMHSPGPASVGSFDSWRQSDSAASLPNMGSSGWSAITNSFRTPKEPRITVWHPETGKTISGNAAPCRRNLDEWMARHPGWQPKAERQLSSARRSRAKKSRPMSVPASSAIAINLGGASSLDGQSPLAEAVQGLLGLGMSVGSYNSTSGGFCGSRGRTPTESNTHAPKNALISSVSSSGAENEDMSSDDEDDDDKMEM